MKQNSALKEAETTFKFIVYPAVAGVPAYMTRRPDGGRSQTVSPSSAHPRCASVPMETGGFRALRQSRCLWLRAEILGQEAGPTELIFHAFTTGKVRKTRLSSCGAVSPRIHARFGGPGARSRRRGRPLEHWPRMKVVLSRSNVGTRLKTFRKRI